MATFLRFKWNINFIEITKLQEQCYYSQRCGGIVLGVKTNGVIQQAPKIQDQDMDHSSQS